MTLASRRSARRLPAHSAAGACGLLLFAVLSACTSLQVRTTDAKGGGVPFYLSKPYLLVKPNPAGPGTVWEIVYLPDTSQKLYVAGQSFFSGLAVTLGPGGVLQAVAAGASSPAEVSAPAPSLPVPSWGSLAAPAHLLAAPAKGCLDPGLYALTLDTNGKISSLPTKDCPKPAPPLTTATMKVPEIREIQVVTSTGVPEVAKEILVRLEREGNGAPQGARLVVISKSENISAIDCDDKLSTDPLDCKANEGLVRFRITEAWQEQNSNPPRPFPQRKPVELTFSVHPLLFPDDGEALAGDAVLYRIPEEGRLASMRPSAELSFDPGLNGLVKEFTIRADRRGGSAVKAEQSSLVVQADGRRLLWPPADTDAKKNHVVVAELGMPEVARVTLPFAARSLEVLLRPINTAGLEGALVHARYDGPAPVSEVADEFSERDVIVEIDEPTGCVKSIALVAHGPIGSLDAGKTREASKLTSSCAVCESPQLAIQFGAQSATGRGDVTLVFRPETAPGCHGEVTAKFHLRDREGRSLLQKEQSFDPSKLRPHNEAAPHDSRTTAGGR